MTWLNLLANGLSCFFRQPARLQLVMGTIWAKLDFRCRVQFELELSGLDLKLRFDRGFYELSSS